MKIAVHSCTAFLRHQMQQNKKANEDPPINLDITRSIGWVPNYLWFLLRIELGGVLIINEGLSNLGEEMKIKIFSRIMRFIRPNIIIVISHEKNLAACVDEIIHIDNLNISLSHSSAKIYEAFQVHA